MKDVCAGKVLTITVWFLIAFTSKACKGCPVSCEIKLVTSTTLLIERMPIAGKLFFSQLSDGPTFTPLMVMPM
jgi:hypothetical protein